MSLDTKTMDEEAARLKHNTIHHTTLCLEPYACWRARTHMHMTTAQASTHARTRKLMHSQAQAHKQAHATQRRSAL